MHHYVVISAVLLSGILTPVCRDYPATLQFPWKKNLNYNVVPEIIPRYASSVGIRYNFTNAESPSAPSSSRAGEHDSFPNFQVESIEKPSGLALAYFNRLFFSGYKLCDTSYQFSFFAFAILLRVLDCSQFITCDKPRCTVDKIGGEIEACAANR